MRNYRASGRGSTPLDKSRLRWQCRRGMKELDQLLVAYLDEHYDAADDTEKAAFQSLLELPDPELIGYLLGKQPPEEESMTGVVARIRRRPENQ